MDNTQIFFDYVDKHIPTGWTESIGTCCSPTYWEDD